MVVSAGREIKKERQRAQERESHSLNMEPQRGNLGYVFEVNHSDLLFEVAQRECMHTVEYRTVQENDSYVL